MKIFLVEDSPLVRERLMTLLASIEGTSTVGYAASAEEAIRGILAAHPDVVVLDIKLAAGTGFDVLRAVREREPGIDVYMLSNFATQPYRRLAAQLGACDFFDKSTEMNDVRTVLTQRAARTLN